jgi:L-amino acid N-acyltransferase YncA
VIVRPATATDAVAIASLLNAHLATTTIEWTDTAQTAESILDWLDEHETVLVAEERGELVGVAAFGWFRDVVKRPGYRFTVENTIHVREDRWGSGVGGDLMRALVDKARQSGKHTMVAAIDRREPDVDPVPRATRLRRGGHVCPGSVPSSVGGWTSSCSSSVSMTDRHHVMIRGLLTN